MKNLIDYIWNCSAGETVIMAGGAIIIILVCGWIAVWIIEMYLELFKK